MYMFKYELFFFLFPSPPDLGKSAFFFLCYFFQPVKRKWTMNSFQVNSYKILQINSFKLLQHILQDISVKEKFETS